MFVPFCGYIRGLIMISSYPRWCVDALRSVGVDLLDGPGEGMSVIDGNGAKWEYSDVKA